MLKMASFSLDEKTLRMAKEAKLDQGIHETEVSFNGECDLKKALTLCDKNPGHEKFIPINEINVDHFSEFFKEQFVVDFIKVKANETVRIICDCTSEDRPEGYMFHNYRGSSMKRYGSGRIWAVFKDKISTEIPCPFEDCKEAEGYHTVSGYLRVHTAMHVIFDDIEARRTTVEFFYDTPRDSPTSATASGGRAENEQGDNHRVVTARGVRVVCADQQGDYCVFDCVTHDKDLCSTLNNIREEWSKYWPAVSKILHGKDLSVVVSHPHGSSKHLTIGKCIKREWGKEIEDEFWYKYVFDAATCPGCSGAPVWVPGCDGLFSGYAPHSGHEGNHINRSAVWFFWQGKEQRDLPISSSSSSLLHSTPASTQLSAS